jgi:hypothetical protein
MKVVILLTGHQNCIREANDRLLRGNKRGCLKSKQEWMGGYVRGVGSLCIGSNTGQEVKMGQRKNGRALRLACRLRPFLVLKTLLHLWLDSVTGNFFVILLQCRQVLTSFRELALLHTFADVPVNESTLRVHEVKLVVQTAPCLGNGRGVGQHADGAVHRSKFTARNTHGLLVVDPQLEASRAPFHQVERSLGLQGSDGGGAVTRYDISTVEESHGHVLSVARIANDHLVVGLEALEGQVVDLETLVRAAVAGHNRGVGDQRVVNTRIRDQVGLELVQIHVQSAVEPETGGYGADHLSDQAVQMLVAGTRNIKVATANVIDGFVVDQESAVGVLDGAVGGQNSVVWFDYGSRDARRRVDGEFELRLLSIIARETLQEQGAKTGTSTTTEGVEDQETLEGSAVV